MQTLETTKRQDRDKMALLYVQTSTQMTWRPYTNMHTDSTDTT